MLDLLDDSATGRGTVHFPGEEPEPTPIGELWDASEQAARWIAANVGTGGTVAAVLTNTRACVTALFGAWRAGCTVASLPLPARGMSPQRLRRPAHPVLRGRRRADAHGGPGVTHALLDDASLPVHTFDETLAGGPPSSFDGAAALVQFTSGSVGTPKGIHLTLDAVGAHVLAILAALEPGAGRRLVLLAAAVPRHGPDRTAPVAARGGRPPIRSSPSHAHEAGDVHGQPAVVAADVLGDGGDDHRRRRTSRWSSRCARAGASGALDLSRLRSIIVGSESVRADTLVRFADAFEPAGFRPMAFCPGYGLAEATLAVTIVRPHEPWRSIAPPADQTRRRQARLDRSCPPVLPSTESTCG